MAPLPFPGGEHVPTYPKLEALKQSARDWMALAAEHNKAAAEAVDAGYQDTAIVELAHAERKTEFARLVMIEYRTVESGTVR